MKECAWCGRENENDAVHCRECGTAEFKGDITVTLNETLEKPTGASYSTNYKIPPLATEDEKSAWVTIVRCPTLAEADLIASRLEAAGITVLIPDQFLMQASPWNAGSGGFTRVQVSPRDYEAARSLIMDESIT